MEKNIFARLIASALNLQERAVANTLALLEEGCTIPFISRYRKERTGGLDEVQIAAISDRFDKLKEIDLSDFVKNHPEFETIWNALNQREAFANTANLLAVGDMIEFVVDPTFPTYEGQYQILLTVMKGGERKVLNILSSQTDKYYNLAELRKAIDEEYQAFVREHPNDVFVFSKKATAWAKRPGLIDYDFSGNGIIDSTRKPYGKIQEIRLLACDEEVLDEADDILGEELEELNRESRYCYTPTEIGKAFGLDGRDLNSFLADQKIIRWARGQWQLTQKYLHRELTANRYSYVHGRDGRRKLVSRLVWTEKGREFIMDMIKR